MSKTIERIHGASSPSHAVIWLHGLGATCDDFASILPYLALSERHSVRFVFPQAPDRPITLNGGYVMPGWYDIKGMDLSDKEDLEGISQSQATVESLIEEQVSKGVASENIILAGFSQGGAVAYYTGIRSSHRIAGILALSTYLPFLNQVDAEHSGINLSVPIMAMHGQADPVVPLAAGKLARSGLEALGYKIEWKEYQMEHTVTPDQLADIGVWINRVFAG